MKPITDKMPGGYGSDPDTRADGQRVYLAAKIDPLAALLNFYFRQ
jgi:hypothetical protein